MLKYRLGWLLGFLLLLNLVLVGVFMAQKQVIHPDEMFSYGHANSSQGTYLSKDMDPYFVKLSQIFYNKWIDGRYLFEYLTVQEDETFNYGMVWDNLANGVHPPLYYVLLHTVCSFFPNQFSFWFSGGLNIFLWCLLLIAYLKLAKEFFPTNVWAMLPVLLYAFSAAGFSTVLFLRLYVLQTLFAVCLVYEHVKLLKKNDANLTSLLLIFLYAAGGNLTQYSSLVFAFVMAGITCFCLLMRKNYSLLFKYALVMLGSALFLFVVFPPAFDVIIFSPRAQQSVGVFNHTLKDGVVSFLVFFDNRFAVSYKAIVLGLLEFKLPFSILLLLMIFYLVVAAYQNLSSTIEIRWLVTLFGIMFFFLVLMMPNMANFHLRYFMFLVPMAAILLVRFIYAWGKCVHLSEKWMLWGCWLILIWGLIWHNIFLTNPRTLFNYPNTAQTEEFMREIKNKNVVMVEGLSWMAFFASTYYLKDAKQVYYVFETIPEQALDKADFLLYMKRGWSNTVTNTIANFSMKPCDLPFEIKQKLEYVSMVNVGWMSFDFYKVRR